MYINTTVCAVKLRARTRRIYFANRNSSEGVSAGLRASFGLRSRRRLPRRRQFRPADCATHACTIYLILDVQSSINLSTASAGGGFPGGGHRQQRQQQRPSGSLYATDPNVVELSDGSFPGGGEREVYLIEFYAPW